MPNELVPKALQDARKEVYDTKWKSLEARGITKPKDEEERRQRLKDAHGY